MPLDSSQDPSEAGGCRTTRGDANGEYGVPSDVANLLLEIARCPVVRQCLDDPELDHPCAEIVRSQGVATVADFQMPEPWNGPIATAPILFVSSNPSISFDEAYPRADWPDARIVGFFEGHFGGGREEWTLRGLHYQRKDGSFTSGNDWVRFWAWAKNRACKALNRPAVPGRDYAITEIVRCKSIGERGVAAAARYCPDRYLDRTLFVAAAGLLICAGKFAGDELRRCYGLQCGRALVGPVEIADRRRYIAFLDHPNRRRRAGSPERKKLVDAMTGEQLAAVRSFLKGT
jgi:hypothetical protein